METSCWSSFLAACHFPQVPCPYEKHLGRRRAQERAPAAYFKSVQNGTVWLLPRYHHASMPHTEAEKEPGNTARASAGDIARIPERPSVTMPGTVDKIIPSPRPGQPEKAQIAVEGADPGYRDLRIENALADENGDDVRLKRGAHVEVTVTAEPETSTAAISEGRNLAAETPSYSAMSRAERSLHFKLDGFRLVSHANPGDKSD